MSDAAAIAAQVVDIQNDRQYKLSRSGKRFGRKASPLGLRFYERFIPEPNSGCWIWTGTICGRGYGAIKDENRVMRRASRVSWEIHRGPIPVGLCVCHKCDVPLCVNPEHLFIGTNADNTNDMICKGRWSRGTKKERRNKLSHAQVFEIRNSTLPRRELAAIYGVTKHSISSIRTRRTWSHI